MDMEVKIIWPVKKRYLISIWDHVDIEDSMIKPLKDYGFDVIRAQLEPQEKERPLRRPEAAML